MLEGIAGVFLKAFLSQLFTALFGFLQRQQDDAAQRDLGRVTAERDQATAGIELQKQLGTIAATPVDVLGRLERGDA